MVEKIKELLYSLLAKLNYSIADTRNESAPFPQIFMRTNGHKRYKTNTVRYDTITIVFDIFSNYSGEKEILDITETIGDNIDTIQENNPEIIFIEQTTLKILDDNSRGVQRKHGVLAYIFTCMTSLVDDEEEDTDNG